MTWVLFLCALFSRGYSTCVDAVGESFVWEVEESAPFDELLVSWNGDRPDDGELLISLSVRNGESWSPYTPYMRWGSHGQTSIQRDQDQFLRSGEGFRVLVEGPVENLWSLSASASNLADFEISLPSRALESVALMGVARQSQIVLDHPRHRGLCSPTSTAIAIHHLRAELDPLGVAKGVNDERLDIYGNWVLNTAEAASRIGRGWRAHVQRLGSFEELHGQLARGLPVVVSVKGELPGGALPYNQGHLMVVIGYDAEKREVLVIDPAFPTSEETAVAYDLDDFLAVWAARKNLAYLFDTDRCRLAPTDADGGNTTTAAPSMEL